MLTRVLVAIVWASCRAPWLILSLALAGSFLAADYAARNFSITTDTGQLVASHLPWRQRELAYDAAFPQHMETIVVVIDAPTPERAEAAAQSLEASLRADTEHFRSLRRPDGGEFFERNGLLFLTPDEVRTTTEELIRAQPFLGTLAADPTLRGLARALSFIPEGVKADRISLSDFEKPLSQIAGAIESLLAGETAAFSWSELMTGEEAKGQETRRFIYVKPVLDFSALEPGAMASAAIRKTAASLGLTPEADIRVRLTGSVALADEEFATVADGALVNNAVTLAAVILILWLALRSGRIILAVVVSLFVGLILTAAAGLAMVGAFNVISVAFAVLFVGIGVDFGIQFAVRYRQERHEIDDLKAALESAATQAGKPLALAAAATAAGFYSFAPTDFRGVSELGLIAGTGMLIAFLTSVTLLPALLMLLKPRGEPAEVGYRWLAPVDRFLARHRGAVLLITALAVIAGLPLLFKLKFDFNPLNLRSARVELVATMLDLMKKPETALDKINVLLPSLDDAEAMARRLDALPEVAQTLTLESFVPEDQEEKLATIADAASLLGPTLDPSETAPKPSDGETLEALRDTAQAYVNSRAGSLSIRLAGVLRQLAAADPARRAKIERELMEGFGVRLRQIRNGLKAAPVTLDSLPHDLVRDWKTEDGRTRVEVAPKGDASDNANLKRFVKAVLAVAPQATGTPVLIQELADVVVEAFIQAAALALVSITAILLIVLRRVTDVLLTLVPLLLASVVTLELMVLIDLPLNFANIIALPLLLGVGVAFKIYYVLAWRAGETSLLASPLTRAVFFSALTTATAFASLWFSSHPGTASMGKLLSLSLVTTLFAAVLFQPILMGPPREKVAPKV